MGLFGRTKISELDAAKKVFEEVCAGVGKDMKRLLKEYTGPMIEDLFPGFPESLGGRRVAHYFAATVLVAETKALPNLFPAEQAERLRALVLGMMCALGEIYFERTGEDLEIADYIVGIEFAWDEALASSSSLVAVLGEPLYDAIGVATTIEFAGELRRDPLGVQALGGTCIDLASGRWKRIASNYLLT